MKEAEKIKVLFADLYNGSPWLEVTLIETLEKITADRAAAKPTPECNSIWEIINHMVSWRQNVLQRLRGVNMITPADNYFRPVPVTSPQSWQQTLRELQQSQADWLIFLDGITDADLEERYPPSNDSYYKLIHVIIQHDAYHLGQVVLLLKLTR